MSINKISNNMHSERQLVSSFNTNYFFITLFCIQKDFLCKLEVVLQPVQDDWEQLSLQLNIDQVTLTDIRNKEDSNEKIKRLLEWVVKKDTLTQLEEGLHNLGKTDVISGMYRIQ